MRPTIGLDTRSTRPRKQSDPNDRHGATGSTTFFLARESETNPTPRTTSTPSPETDESPVRSLKETLEEADKATRHNLTRYRPVEVRSSSRRRSTIKPGATEELRNDAGSHGPPFSQPLSGSLTPSLSMSQGPSVPSSPKSISSRSFTKSEDDLTQDETGSQAIISSEDEDDDEVSAEVQDSAPQLVMPSIKMPSRRPFTERGKHLGKFKIMVAGRRGSGRTSLVKSIVQLCEDIVHVDPLQLPPKSTSHHRPGAPRSMITVDEVFASTRPYPSWWSDIDESRVLRRRKSMGDSVLERNICFVVTTDSGRIETIIQYLEQQLVQAVNNVAEAGPELVHLLSGRGGSQVDVVLYLVSRDSIKEDCDNIQRISKLSNVVPLISKADLLSSETITELKASTFNGIALPHLPFDQSLDAKYTARAPYSVSSANGSDFDNMDASLLMSSEYVRPLVSSELPLLIEQLFAANTVSYLRHTSAKKLVSWYAAEPRPTKPTARSVRSEQGPTSNSPLPTSLSNSGVFIPVASHSSLNASNSFALAKVADHTSREEHLAQIRLSKWASDLQLSLQRERERYEYLAQSERAIWLVQRMGEEIRDGKVVPAPNGQGMIKMNERSRTPHPDIRYEIHDPLGLLQWHGVVKTGGWAALQIAGSFGVVGGVALWLARTWGLTTSLHEWAQQWSGQLFSMNE